MTSAFDIRPCREGEEPQILAIINAAAERYRGVIPDDCWHEPYMPAQSLAAEIAAGVAFQVAVSKERIVGAMGVQPVKDVTLIRHAYVHPDWQGHGIGGALLARLTGQRSGPILIGTWAAAEWAIAFYQRHGFSLVSAARTPELLRTYWTISDRQVETSVVLTNQPGI